ncbi:MAG: C45 family peptidase [bacterium]|nr:C45 family peptidase [bacterium]
MPHKNFHQFKAKDNFELGTLMGLEFGDIVRQNVASNSVMSDWKTKVERAKKFLKFNQEYFPEYVEEMYGYAKGANVDFTDLYTLSLEDEVTEEYSEKCSTIITSDGMLIAHNEDWEKYAEDKIYIIEKQIRDLKILELYYLNTLGGNSVSINSNGFVICINSLVSKETKMGLSKNVIARWLSETKDPDKDFEKLKSIPRALGYSGNIINSQGKIWNIEYNSSSAVLTRPQSPFVHTNHYLTSLSESEANTNTNGTYNRYRTATEKIKPQMNITEIETLMNDQTDGPVQGLMNERTIAKIIVDLPAKIAKIWLLRESELGFIDYPLPF